MNSTHKPRLAHYRLATGVTFALLSLCQAAWGGDLEDRFRQEYPLQRAEWKRIEPGLPKSDICTVSIEKDGKFTPSSRLTHKERRGCYVRVLEFLEPQSLPTGVKFDAGTKLDQVDFAYVRNDRYSFELSKEKSGWVVRGANTNAPSREASIEAISRVPLRKVFFPEYELPAAYKQTYLHFRFSDDYDALLSTRDFQLLSISQPERNGLVRVEYRNTFHDDRLQKDYPATGWVTFDPNRYWAPCEFSFTFGDGQRQVTRTRKATLLSGTRYPLVKSSKVTETLVTGKTSETKVRRNDHEVRFGDDVEETEFRLTAFGLPEPPGVVWPKRTPNYVWFLIAAGIAAVLAILFRWLARRSRRAGETSPPPAVT